MFWMVIGILFIAWVVLMAVTGGGLAAQILLAVWLVLFIVRMLMGRRTPA